MARALERFAKAKTAVFWDVNGCKIPDDVNAVEVSRNIRAALEKVGYCGSTTIYAYGDTKKIEADFESKGYVVKQHTSADSFVSYHGTASVYASQDTDQNPEIVVNHISKDDPESSIHMIFTDSLCWSLDTPPPANLLLILGSISGHMEFGQACYFFNYGAKYNLLCAQPQNTSAEYQLPCAPTSEIWVWETLSVGGDPLPEWSSFLDQLTNSLSVPLYESVKSTSDSDVDPMADSDVEPMAASKLAICRAKLINYAETHVLWDVKSWPIPHGVSARDVIRNIKTVLREQNLFGLISVIPYLENADMTTDDFDGIPVYLLFSEGDKDKRLKRLLLDLLLLPLREGSLPLNVMLIAGDINSKRKDLNFFEVFNLLQSKLNYRILLAQPPTLSDTALTTYGLHHGLSAGQDLLTKNLSIL
ncbi:hypothetical protein V5N11_019115 [Cardamine amara subsp. amara]|uniref:NYN domain-containing protein n=1 Tax=Cardamine amara subsp. amara TaxID=228776 RepID=A0ABD1AF94_CARAN